MTNLLLGQFQQLLPGLFDVFRFAAQCDLVAVLLVGGEVDLDAVAPIDDGPDQAALGADQRVVELGVDGHGHFHDIGLKLQAKKHE